MPDAFFLVVKTLAQEPDPVAKLELQAPPLANMVLTKDRDHDIGPPIWRWVWYPRTIEGYTTCLEYAMVLVARTREF